MADTDRTRWDARWAGRDPGEPAPPDVLADRHDLLDQLPFGGRALDVACGLGGQSVWLAQRGFSVLAVDVSGEAIAATQAAAREHDVADAVDARRVDLDAGLPAGAVDLDVIVCQRFRGTDLYPQFVERLQPGGVVVLTVLSEVGAAEPGPFHAPGGELTDAFDALDVDVIHDVEADGQASIIARRRPGDVQPGSM